MDVCEFSVGDGPLGGKKVTQGEWHFLALTIGPKIGGGYQVMLQVDGVTHYNGGDETSQFTIMGIDFWRTPDCIQDNYERRLCTRYETRFSLGRDVGEPGQTYEGIACVCVCVCVCMRVILFSFIHSFFLSFVCDDSTH